MESTTQLIVIGSSVFSGVILAYSLSKAGTEAKIRPGLEWARAAIGLTTLLVIGALIGTQTEPALGFGALAVGGVLGFIQGRQTVVTIKADGPWAVRTLWGIMLWSVGLIAMQLAGLSTRTGAFRFGQAITMFSVAVTVGVIFGRSTPEKIARSKAAGITAAALLIAPLLAVPLLAADSAPAEAQEETDTQRPTLLTGEIQITLIWNGPADIDLSTTEPGADRPIWHEAKTGPLGGVLSLDSNRDCRAGPSIENIAWADGTPDGVFTIDVFNYSQCNDGDLGTTGYRLEIRADGVVRVADSGSLAHKERSEPIMIEVRNREILSATGGQNLDLEPPQTGTGETAAAVDEEGNLTTTPEPTANDEQASAPQPIGREPSNTGDAETIDDDEAVAANIAAVIAAIAMGVLTLAEGQEAIGLLLSGRGGRSGSATAAHPAAPSPTSQVAPAGQGPSAPPPPGTSGTAPTGTPPPIPAGPGGTPSWVPQNSPGGVGTPAPGGTGAGGSGGGPAGQSGGSSTAPTAPGGGDTSWIPGTSTTQPAPGTASPPQPGNAGTNPPAPGGGANPSAPGGGDTSWIPDPSTGPTAPAAGNPPTAPTGPTPASSTPAQPGVPNTPAGAPTQPGAVVTNPDGSTITANPDGSTTTRDPNGNITSHQPPPTSPTTPSHPTQPATGAPTPGNQPGTPTQPGAILTNPDGSTITANPDGSTTTRDPNGNITSHQPPPTTGAQLMDQHGSSANVDATGTANHYDPQGNLVSSQAPLPPGASEVTHPDGSTTTTNPNGSTTTRDPNGNITSHQPPPTTGAELTDDRGHTYTVNANGTITHRDAAGNVVP